MQFADSNLSPPGESPREDEQLTCEDIAMTLDFMRNHTAAPSAEISKLRIVALSVRGRIAEANFRRLDAIKHLDRAIDYRRWSVLLTPESDKEKPSRLNSLGGSYLLRFQRRGEISDVDKAIISQIRAVQLTPDGHVDKLDRLGNLKTAYMCRFQCLRELLDLDKAIECQLQATQLVSDNHPSKPGLLNNLGSSYRSRFQCLGQLLDLDKAIDFQKEAARLATDGHPDRPGVLSNLGITLQSRFQHLGEVLDLEEAIDYGERALQFSPDGDTDKSSLLANLGISYACRFQRLGNLPDLDKAIDSQSQAVHLTRDNRVAKPDLLNNLGISYRSRFERLGELSDIDKAIESQSQALQLAPDGHPDRPGVLTNLGNSYQCRFNHLAKLSDLDKALACQREAVDLTPQSHADRPGRLINLGIIYQSRFERLSELSDLVKAIEYSSEAVKLTPNGHPDKPTWLNNLAISYGLRFSRLGELSDLDMAIVSQDQAVQLTPEDHADKPRRLHNRGTLHLSRFRHLGELADIDKAVQSQSQAVKLVPNGHVVKPSLLTSLGNSYQFRAMRLGELSDLNEAVDCQKQASELTPNDHAEKPRVLTNLGLSYLSRFEGLGEISDLEDAVACHSEAMRLIPGDHANEPGVLSNLGISYQCRFERSGELSDLDNAIDYQSKAVQLAPDGYASKPGFITNIGNSYRRRFERLGELSDLNNAIEYQTRAVHHTPDTHADKPGLLTNLALAYKCRFKRLGEQSDLQAAVSACQGAALSVAGPPETRCRTAREWAKSANLLGISPLAAYQRVMELVPELVWLGTTVDRRYGLVVNIGDATVEAASCAISLQSYSRALEWLEQGRSVIWNQILQLRTPFDELATVNPDLANRLAQVSHKLEQLGSRSTVASLSTQTLQVLEEDAQYHRRLATEWDQLLNQARQTPGFGNFLRPPQADALACAAKDGPVIVINVHQSRCDALIIRPNSNSVAHVPLDSFSLEEAVKSRVQLGSLIGHRGTKARGLIVKHSRTVPNAEKTFKQVLAALWQGVVKPVLDFLGYTRKLPVDELPHVTWCTTGLLSFAPLHAAGCYDGIHPNAFDLVVSSYTPTLSALLPSPHPVSSSQAGILAVGQQNTSGLNPLPYTVPELLAVKEHSNGVRYMQLDGEHATVDAVLDAMGEYSWVHLACHAVQNKEDPAQSAFHLHDDSLMLSAITKRSFKNNGLAFLSACQTATGDEKLPDEAVHLAAGMLMAGYSSVIATLWSIRDEDAPNIARDVYSDLLKGKKMDSTGASRALHKGVKSLCEQVGENSFERWVPFVHIGS